MQLLLHEDPQIRREVVKELSAVKSQNTMSFTNFLINRINPGMNCQGSHRKYDVVI
jgi:hypothetical protein